MRVQRFYKIIVVCLLLLPAALQAQTSNHSGIPGLHFSSLPPGRGGQVNPADSVVRIRKNSIRLSTLTRIPSPVTAAYYVSNLGFFCRKEWQVEKSIRIPLKLRLGSLDYVDRLEGKRKF